ncbi:MAG: phosphoribosylglycinamide formyltransferase [Burkholderiales bacterium]|nr:MAG: phosphoribosylglycinamide formyltransferase [Burkholderiales bacterium]
MKRIAILISGRGSNMAALIAACERERWPAEVVAVLSDREGAAGLERARASGVTTEVVARSAFDSRESFDAALAARIDHYRADLVALAGFMRVLGDDLVERLGPRLVNIHPSLLPAFPGLHTHRRALEAGVRVHGATVHFVTAQLDRGPIIAQAAVAVHAGDTESSLAARVLAAEHRLYPLALRWLVEDRVRIDGTRVSVQGIGPADQLLWHHR